MQQHYLKALYEEHFDPFQLRMLVVSSNQSWEDLLEEYNLKEMGIYKRFTTPVALWHERKVKALAYGV